MKSVIVIGSGATGLPLAVKLAEKGFAVTLLEKEKQVGGLATSFKYKDFTIDFGPHKIYTQIPEAQKFIEDALGEDLLAKPKKSKIRLMGKYFDYPVNIRQVMLGLNPLTTMSCGFSYGIATVTSKFSKNEGNTYESYLTNKFGPTVYNLIFKDFAWKVWGDPQKLSSDLAKARVSIPSLPEMLKRVVLGDGGKKEISAKTFYYPKKGNIELYEKLAEKFEDYNGELILGAKVIELKHKDDKITEVIAEVRGRPESFKADYVVSTMPLSFVASSLKPKPPVEVLNAFNNLKHRSIVLLFVIVNKDRLFDDSFIFYPEKLSDFPFHRLSEQKAFSEHTVPKDKTVLCVEMIREPTDEIFNKTDKEILDYVMPALEKTGFLKKEDVAEFFTKKMHGIYPVYDLTYKENLTKVLAYLDEFNNFMTLGRRGLFNYNNQDHCIDMALHAEKFIDKWFAGSSSLEEWRSNRKKFEEYVIID
ncbi:FAD-dependent oxidoreductase [Candidatus Micrarchaeota archaeon]|nr:FAD-dependent oxidoreductase [Candidatus Micrarchaeota archaeon]